jgi:hypothetical protein
VADELPQILCQQRLKQPQRIRFLIPKIYP